MYCEMAVNAYYCAERLDKMTVSDEDINDLLTKYRSIYKLSITAVVFSAMCIEAFLNDYAAACLGDDNFYGKLEKRPTICKLEHITKKLLKTEIDESKPYYSGVIALIENRNKCVHPKSRGIDVKASLNSDFDITKYIELDLNINNAENALKAVRDLAYFFDEHDANIHAIQEIFNLDSASNGNKTIEFITSKLGIKVSDYEI